MTDYKEKYNQLIESFINNNRKLLDNLPIIGEPDDDGRLNYENFLPDNTDELYEIPELKALFDEFYEKFINIEGLKFDVGGHFKNFDGLTFQEVINNPDISNCTEELFRKRHRFGICVDLFDRYGEIKNPALKQKGYKFLFITGRIEQFMNAMQCKYCSETVYLALDYKTNTIKFNNDTIKNCPSKKSKEIDEIDIELEVPSKKLVFLNSPFRFLRLEREDQYETTDSSVLGRVKTTEMYAKVNVGFFEVGNTNPRIFKNKEEIVIASIHPSMKKYKKMTKHHDEVGQIDTELWWYTVLDYELFKRLLKNKNLNIKDIKHTVVDINNTVCFVTHKTDTEKNVNKWFTKIKF